jgi:ATP-dependent RNA helicase DDX35
MAEFPLHPTHSKALLSGENFGCTQEMLSIIALLQVQNVFTTPSGRKKEADKAKLKFACVEGDHLTILNVYKVFKEKYTKSKIGSVQRWCSDNFLNFKSLQRASLIRDQLTALLRKFHRRVDSTCGDQTDPILKCLTSAFFLNTAKISYTGDYKHLRSDLTLKVHPSSVINLYLANTDEPPPKYIIYNDIVQSKTQHLMRDIFVIDCKWLNELVDNYYEYGTAREMSEKRLKLE